jgi:hypothetical protein
MVISPTVLYIEDVLDGVHTHPEDENHESNTSLVESPSHAQLPKKKGKCNFSEDLSALESLVALALASWINSSLFPRT